MTPRMKHSLAALAAFAAAILAPGLAHAKYSLCNKTSYVLSAAIAYVDGDRLATRGWWRLRPGQCRVVLAEPTDPGRYFVYAESIPGHEGPLRAWSGDTPLCVETQGFFNLRNQEVCRDDPARQRGFFAVDVTAAASGDWQTDFAEAENWSVFSAEVAGVQRLLRDVGASTGPIDASLGRQTQRDLAAFRAKKNLGDGAVIDNETIDALVEEANALEQKAGLYFCNKTETDIWTAVAEPSGENYRARGWWLLTPEECGKVVKGKLKSDHYYVYGAIESPEGEQRLAGGDRKLCVNLVKFDTTDATSCADQELEEAVFRRFDVAGAANATFEFRGDLFVRSPALVDR